eukprot:Transcript_26356.p8 GENE.Transcript_26356~~Transcript_26356.p8  ORF type:complete len:103 (+),score=30.14 Transcript_26356:396-704(+)
MGGGGMHNPYAAAPPDVQEELQRWVAAKRATDFATADAIRQALRDRGVDPDGYWPGSGPLGGAETRPGDWMCPNCNVKCFASKGSCFRCHTPKPPPRPPPGQ